VRPLERPARGVGVVGRGRFALADDHIVGERAGALGATDPGVVPPGCTGTHAVGSADHHGDHHVCEPGAGGSGREARRCGHRPRTRVGSLCTGYGGLDLGVAALLDGAEVRWCADSDRHVAQIIAARFPGVPNLGDITGVDWGVVEPVDVITAGFPCQDISAAGRGCGIEEGSRSGVWINVLDAVRVLRPGLLVVENVAALRWRGLGRVLGDLAQAGYDARWYSVRACDIGAPHRRERVFVAAHPAGTRFPRLRRPGPVLRSAGWPAAERRGLPPAAADPDGPRRPRPGGARPDGEPPGRPHAGRSGVRAADRGAAAAHAPGRRHRNAGTARGCGVPPVSIPGAAADPKGERWDQRQPEPARLQRRPDPARGGHPDHPPRRSVARWGPYEAAITRWEHSPGIRSDLSVSFCVGSSTTSSILMPGCVAVCRAVSRHTSKRRANMAPMCWVVLVTSVKAGTGRSAQRTGPLSIWGALDLPDCGTLGFCLEGKGVRVGQEQQLFAGVP
jgi:DNA (cytosine-5)-methyltransferase 1